MAYATLAQVKLTISANAENPTNPFPAKDDSTLTRLLDAATTTIDRAVSRSRPRTFAASGDTTRTFDAIGDVIGSTLYLSTDLATTPTTVSNNGTPVAGAGYKLLGVNNSNLAPYQAIRLLGSTWAYTTYSEDAASITGRFAYSVTPPDSIVQACIQLVVSTWRQRNTVANISSAMISADGTLVLPDGLPKSVVDLLEPYIV